MYHSRFINIYEDKHGQHTHIVANTVPVHNIETVPVATFCFELSKHIFACLWGNPDGVHLRERER